MSVHPGGAAARYPAIVSPPHWKSSSERCVSGFLRSRSGSSQVGEPTCRFSFSFTRSHWVIQRIRQSHASGFDCRSLKSRAEAGQDPPRDGVVGRGYRADLLSQRELCIG